MTVFRILFVLFFTLSICFHSSYAARVPGAAGQQPARQTSVTLNMRNSNLVEILREIQRQTGVEYGFNREVDVSRVGTFSLNVSGATMERALEQLFAGTQYTYTMASGRIVIVRRSAQSANTAERITITGRVLDDGRVPMVGVSVVVVGSTIGVATDANGMFVINVRPGDELMFTFVGYQNVRIPITAESKDLVVVLKQEATAIQDVVVTGSGIVASRESVVGAVTSVNAEQLRSSSSDLTTAFAGNIAGMVAWQTGGIPGALTESEMNTKFYIRGITSFQTDANIDPLILLDGVESSKLDLARIDPEDIESFNVLKDASATAMYGARGANGVIYITTKKGQSGSVYTSARYEAIATMPTREIDVVDPVTYMKLYNEASFSRNPSIPPKYTLEQINNTGNPDYPSFVYPANDWYKTMFKPMSVNHHAAVNIRGGSDVVQYYSSLTYNQDNGMLKTDRLNQFDVNIKNKGMTLRVNLNIDLTKKIKLVVNSFSTYDKYHGPAEDVSTAYYYAFNASPVDFAATYPADDYYSWDHIRFGGSNASENPYARVHYGYTDRMRYSTTNRAEYIHDLDMVTDGLEFRASASFAQEGYFSSTFVTSPYYYALRDYDFATGKHTLLPLNDGSKTLGSTPLYPTSTGLSRLGGDIRLLYDKAWADNRISAAAVFNIQENWSALPPSLFQSFPKRNMSLAARLSYGYKDRYYFEGSFGYNGSERFAKKNRMGFFPSVGASWIVSSEPFMASVQETIPYLKLRASWGKVGNDGIISNPRFVHLSTINTYGVTAARPIVTIENAYRIMNNPNPEVTWEVAEQYNLGLDFKLFKGLFEVNADIYKEIRHNVLDYRTTIPVTVGLTGPELANVGKVNSRGIDLSLKVQHAFTQDLWVILNSTLTFNKATFLEIEEALGKPEWQRREGREISQAFGYIADGLFQDWGEINNSPFQGGDVMPGDIRYRDINDDGKIDIYDAVPIGFPETPRLIYGFNAFINYKNFELQFAFQGMGKRSFFLNAEALSPLYGNHAVLQKIADDHWTAGNASNKPFWPRLSTSNIISHNPQEDYDSGVEVRKSTYFMYDGQFIRCRSIELGYNLPKKLAEKMNLRTVKLFARANNPFIISAFKVWDIELGSDGFNYPIQRTYSAGINVTF